MLWNHCIDFDYEIFKPLAIEAIESFVMKLLRRTVLSSNFTVRYRVGESYSRFMIATISENVNLAEQLLKKNLKRVFSKYSPH